MYIHTHTRKLKRWDTFSNGTGKQKMFAYEIMIAIELFMLEYTKPHNDTYNNEDIVKLLPVDSTSFMWQVILFLDINQAQQYFGH